MKNKENSPFKKTNKTLKNIDFYNINKKDFSDFDGAELLKSKIELRKQKRKLDENYMRISSNSNKKNYKKIKDEEKDILRISLNNPYKKSESFSEEKLLSTKTLNQIFPITAANSSTNIIFDIISKDSQKINNNNNCSNQNEKKAKLYSGKNQSKRSLNDLYVPSLINFVIKDYNEPGISFNNIYNNLYINYLKLNSLNIQLDANVNLEAQVENKHFDESDEEENSEFLVDINLEESNDLKKRSLKINSIYNRLFSFIINFKEDDFYRITGYLDNREFKIIRSISEFISFRELLCLNYPGIFIPSLPTGLIFKTNTNQNKIIVNLRKLLIQSFFEKLSKISLLTGSKELKNFLDSRNNNFSDIQIEFFNKSIKEILDTYKSFFPMFSEKKIERINENSGDILIDKDPFYLSKEENGKIIDFYYFLLSTKKVLYSIIDFTTSAQTQRLELNKENEVFYELLFEYDNHAIVPILELNDSEIKKYNKDIVECKLTEFLFDTNFENPFSMLFNWLNNEMIDIESMIDCIENVFKYDSLAKEKINILKEKNKLLEQYINPSFLNRLFIPKDYSYINEIIFDINNLKLEIQDIISLTQMLYKILNFIVVPSFKKDKIKSYFNIITALSEVHFNKHEKDLIICENLNDHCEVLSSILKKNKNTY